MVACRRTELALNVDTAGVLLSTEDGYTAIVVFIHRLIDEVLERIALRQDIRGGNRWIEKILSALSIFSSAKRLTGERRKNDAFYGHC
jgi:hypothetical protein